MACEHIKIPGHKGEIIVCGIRSRKHFCACGRACEFECDWKTPIRKSGTCDRALCSHHAKEVAPGKHLCPEHQKAYEAWQRRRTAPPEPQQMVLLP
jgi:hypothetical protein